MKKIEIIIEKNDGLLWGRVETKSWMPTPFGKTIEDVVKNLKELVADYILHEGKSDKAWNKLNWKTVEFEFKYDRVV